MVDPPKTIGNRLKAVRTALEIRTQTAFAAELGVDKSTYNPWEKGTRTLTFEGACLIRRRYGVPLDYLFYGDAAGLPVWLHRRLAELHAA